jgi:phage gpG-like protein
MAQSYASLDVSRYKQSRQMSAIFLELMRKLVRRHAEQSRLQMRASMKEPKTGNRYLGKSGRFIIASAPGEAPAIDTGALFNSIKVKYSDNGLTAEVGTFGDIPYSRRLELGGSDRRGVYIAPRPYVAPVFEKQSSLFISSIHEQIAKTLGTAP